jgi:CRISPR-associated endoribonuclease Cas6
MNRIKVFIKAKNNEVLLPYQNILVGGMNKVLSIINDSTSNNSHDDFDIYCLSNIECTGNLENNNKIKLIENKSHFLISHPDIDFLRSIINVLIKNKNIFNSFEISKIELNKTSQPPRKTRFNNYMVNGIILKSDRFIFDNKNEFNIITNDNKYYTFNNDYDLCTLKMKRIVLKKLEKTKEYFRIVGKECPIDFNENDFNIRFDSSYNKGKIKREKKSSKSKYHHIKNMCPVIIEGNSDIINFIYDVGIGNFTKQGYGRILEINK